MVYEISPWRVEEESAQLHHFLVPTSWSLRASWAMTVPTSFICPEPSSPLSRHHRSLLMEVSSKVGCGGAPSPLPSDFSLLPKLSLSPQANLLLLDFTNFIWWQGSVLLNCANGTHQIRPIGLDLELPAR